MTRTCEREGCGRAHHARGLCAYDYRREYGSQWPSIAQRAKDASRVMLRERLDSVHESLKMGDSIELTAKRAGFPTMSAASRYFYRHGMPELARLFNGSQQ